MVVNNRLLALGGMIEGMLLHHTILNYKYIYIFCYIVPIRMLR